MRVLHISSGNMFGGIETLLVTLARHRKCAPDMEPHFALAFEGRVSRELRETGVPVHILGAVRASRPMTVLRGRRRLRGLLHRARFDVAVCHGPWPHAIFSPAVRASRVPLAFWLHNTADGKHWLQRWAARTPPDLVICNSMFTAGSLPLLYPSCHNTIVPCAVAPSLGSSAGASRAAIRASLATSAEAVVVLQVSRLEQWKGQAVLISALGLLRERPDWVCWIVGQAQTESEGAYREHLRQMARNAGVGERVRFVETPGDVTAYYRAADVFCQPNVEPEPFGIVFVEAMLSGLPVVTSAIGGPCEIVDQSCGVLNPPGDGAALAGSLSTLFTDPILRRTLGEAGTRRARELYDPSVVLPMLGAELAATKAHFGAS